ncbi:MAG: OmpA family protein [Chitinophagaceae bacterium]|nr:OmpA family protein [Chitinophagaceae bacterium]
MSSKKYLVLLCALFASASNVMAQEESTSGSAGIYRGAGYDVTDTSLIPERRMEQQRDFLSNQYDFPSKPRNQWEIGISVGAFNVSGDVRSKNLFTAKNPGQTLGFGVHLRKAWGYIISTRLQFIHGTASGFNWQPSTGYWGHYDNPWMSTGYGTGGVNNPNSSAKPVFYNYKTNVDELSFQLVAALNNVKFHKARNKASLYALAGIGGSLYDTWVDALNAAGKQYDFNKIINKSYENEKPNWYNNYRTRKEKNTDLKNLFDGKYETRAERHDNRPWFGRERTYRTILTAGLGIQFKLGRRVSLAIEDKWSYTNDDLVDGQRWQEWPQPGYGGSAMTRDFDTYNYLSLGLNIHLGGRSVEPLWWMNPLDYGYTEMKRPRGGNNCDMDTDGDGVSDCFDRCPDTPAGVAVDTHGCPIDTDGDGVPDFKDKQLITPTECQPSDADGIGTCPDPECCSKIKPVVGCGNIAGGSVLFANGSTRLAPNAMSQLSQLASAMRSQPTCKVVVMGNGSASKLDQQRSWDRVNAVINYMVDNQGIDRDRFIFQYGQNGNPNTVDYRSAGEGEEGPSNIPPPFPNLRRN